MLGGHQRYTWQYPGATQCCGSNFRPHACMSWAPEHSPAPPGEMREGARQEVPGSQQGGPHILRRLWCEWREVWQRLLHCKPRRLLGGATHVSTFQGALKGQSQGSKPGFSWCFLRAFDCPGDGGAGAGEGPCQCGSSGPGAGPRSARQLGAPISPGAAPGPPGPTRNQSSL